MKLKNILITGNSKTERRKLIDDLISDYHNIYRIKRDCNDLKSYVDFIKKNKLHESDWKTNSLYPPFPDLRCIYSHHSWIRNTENEGVLVIDEIDKIDENGGYVLRTMATTMLRLDKRKKEDGLLITIASLEDIDRFYEKMCQEIPYNYSSTRTKYQIIEQNIKIIDIS
jgi:hypothetical protein